MDADLMKYALDERAFTRAEADTFIGSNFAVGADDIEFGWVIAKPLITVAAMRQFLAKDGYSMRWRT